MKKLIVLGLLFPFLAGAASVNINDVSVRTGGFSASGGATGDSLSVSIENGTNLWGGAVGSWNVSANATAGEHTLTATASNGGTESVSRTFVVPVGVGLSPCQIDGSCPYFGWFAPSVFAVKITKFLKPGEGECPVWITMGCRK